MKYLFDMENLIEFIKALEIQISFLLFIWIVVLIVRNRSLGRKYRKLKEEYLVSKEDAIKLRSSYSALKSSMEKFIRDLDKTRRQVEL
jgi:predicted acetyltransferase